MTTIRPAGKDDHGAEAIAAFLMRAGAEDDVAAAVPIDDPRLSTAYDADGRQRRAGLELYVWRGRPAPAARRRRGASAARRSTSGALRLDAAFFRGGWRAAPASAATTCCAAHEIRAVISDFGGVLTTPLQGSFMHFQEVAGIPLEALGQALMPRSRRATARTRCASSSAGA